uniref:Uncharacterized protein n=1 Tax=Pyxicephalus adspersus TaxID=30357 RepID=A0AAV2ZKE1_PYXAD|nr:TPA: hypothetical protein GDO54_005493 [Pyxicephalus adspersus]
MLSMYDTFYNPPTLTLFSIAGYISPPEIEMQSWKGSSRLNHPHRSVRKIPPWAFYCPSVKVRLKVSCLSAGFILLYWRILWPTPSFDS